MNTDILSRLKSEFQPNVKLAGFTTFQTGGACAGMVWCRSPLELEEALQLLIQQRIDFFVFGEGSNVLVSDAGYPGIVVRYYNDQPQVRKNGQRLQVAGCTLLDHLVQFAAENGLQGLNFASGIPGTVAGAVTGNAGAFGRGIGQFVESVTIMDRKGEKKQVAAADMDFRYRHSRIKYTNEVILEVSFFLTEGDRNLLLEERREISLWRHERHPDYHQLPCAGCVFRNLEPQQDCTQRQSVGRLLDDLGAKTWAKGGARFYDKHANIIIKDPQGTAQDVYDLICLAEKETKEKTHIDLIREVRLVGTFQGMPSAVNTLFW